MGEHFLDEPSMQWLTSIMHEVMLQNAAGVRKATASYNRDREVVWGALADQALSFQGQLRAASSDEVELLRHDYISGLLGAVRAFTVGNLEDTSELTLTVQIWTAAEIMTNASALGDQSPSEAALQLAREWMERAVGEELLRRQRHPDQLIGEGETPADTS